MPTLAFLHRLTLPYKPTPAHHSSLIGINFSRYMYVYFSVVGINSSPPHMYTSFITWHQTCKKLRHFPSEQTHTDSKLFIKVWLTTNNMSTSPRQEHIYKCTCLQVHICSINVEPIRCYTFSSSSTNKKCCYISSIRSRRVWKGLHDIAFITHT